MKLESIIIVFDEPSRDSWIEGHGDEAIINLFSSESSF